MTKYHINPETGEPGACKAVKQCRFGASSEHFASKEEARAAYERTQAWEEDKTAYIGEWEKVDWLTQDPMGLEQATPIEISREAEVSPYDPDLEDFDETKTYRAEPAMANRINELFGQSLDTPVFIKDRNEEYWMSDATLEGDHDVTFIAGQKEKKFASLAGAMQWLAHGDKPSAASVILPDFDSQGNWQGGKVKIMGQGMVSAIITPESLYYPEGASEPSGFYGKDDLDAKYPPHRQRSRYFDFQKVWAESYKG